MRRTRFAIARDPGRFKEGPLAKSTPLLLLAALMLGGWFFFRNYEIEGLDQLKVVPRRASASAASGRLGRGRAAGGTIRIATFNIQVFGVEKLDQPAVMDIIVRAIRQFDVVAIQEVRSTHQDVIPRLVTLLNAGGRQYSYVLGPRLGRTRSKEQYAFVFDEVTLEVDRAKGYTIEDPDDVLHRPPLVACFRARGPPPDQAFTFTLVNVHTDPDEVDDEMNRMDDVLFSVRSDGRGEDDVILLGDFNADDHHLGELGRVAGMTAEISGTDTNTRRTRQYDNLFFQLPATSEYTGHSGVFDFLREYNLTLEQALQVSDHLPVWAEFSRVESGSPTAVAVVPPADTTR